MATNNAIKLTDAGIATYDGAGTFTALAVPLTVPNGGSSVSSNTAYAVLCGGTTSTNPIQSIASVGTSGQVLTSNGAAALPTFQSVASSGAGIVLPWICGDINNVSNNITYFLVNGLPIAFYTASNGTTRVYVPVSGTLTTVYGTISCVTTGTSESCTLAFSVNGGSDVNVTTSLAITAQENNPFSNTSLGISITAGDYVEFKFITPSWILNPSGLRLSASALIE